LVAVTQVDGAPARRLGDALVGPGAVGQVDRDLLMERTVLMGRHARGLLTVLHDPVASSLRGCTLRGMEKGPTTIAATRKALSLRGLVAAAKKKEPAEAHISTIHPDAASADHHRPTTTSLRGHPPLRG